MDGLGHGISALVAALRPAGLWYVVLTASVVLFAWMEQGVAWAAWPLPFAWAAWLWLVVTCLAPVYLLVNVVVEQVVLPIMHGWLPRARRAPAEPTTADTPES